MYKANKRWYERDSFWITVMAITAAIVLTYAIYVVFKDTDGPRRTVTQQERESMARYFLGSMTLR